MALTEIIKHHSWFRPFGARRPRLGAMMAAWRSRRALARLDQQALDDIGVSASQAARESAKSVWDVPANWRE